MGAFPLNTKVAIANKTKKQKKMCYERGLELYTGKPNIHIFFFCDFAALPLYSKQT